MAEEKDDHPEPQWKVIEKMYDEVDDLMTKHIQDNKMNFLEIGVVMMMLAEKFEQTKTMLYLQMGAEGNTSNVAFEGKGENMYK
tara:strand:+ start:481 stop:732 length:252 start_codon:yes stop_codon:yes gene_type:complete